MITKTKITSILKIIARPITDMPFLFYFLTLCLSSVPVVVSVMQHTRILHFILSSAMQGFAMGYLLCVITVCIPWKKWRNGTAIVIGILVALRTFLELGCIATVGRPIDVDSATVMIETDRSEASSFFSQYLTWSACLRLLIPTISIAVICIGLAWVIRRYSKTVWMATVLSVSAIICIAGGCLEFYRLLGFQRYETLQEVTNWYATGKSENPMLINGNYILYGNPLTKGAYIAKIFRLESDDMEDWTKLQEKIWNEQTCQTDSTTADIDIVLIIGESFIRAHSSLYGYPLDTNPRLRQEADSGRLAVFSDVTSPANFTTISLRNTLNLNDIDSDEKWSESPYLPLLMKKGGWNVYHYDNQTAGRNSDVGISRMFYADIIYDHVLEGKSDSTFQYDGPYADYVSRKLKEDEKPGKKFVMYHLLGQHFDFKDRYEGAPHFKVSDIKTIRPWIGDKERQMIADYNNATRYNDSIVDRILDSFRDRDAIVIYFSDHGEDSPELAPVKARNVQQANDPEWLDRQFHIPFMVWMSPAFIENHHDKVQAIHNAIDRPWSTDNLGQMILGLSGINTSYYRKDRDVLSDSFRPYERTTASGYHMK